MISVKRWISALIVAGWCVVPMPGQQPGSMEARPAGEERLHNVLSRQRLEPPLHNDLTQLQFSPDGKFALAQDETGIYALSRRPFAYLFRIEAPYAYPAHFTPDSGGIVYYDAKLTVEKWDVSSQARAWVHQIVLPKPCRQTALSPDGGVLACLDQENGLNLLDSSTGNAVFSKKEFIPWYQAQTFPAFPGAGPPGGGPAEMIGMQFSPDGRYFVACRGPSNIAVDLTTYKPISLPGRV